MTKIYRKIFAVYILSAMLSAVSFSGLAKTAEQPLLETADAIIQQYRQFDWFSGNVAIIKDDQVIYDKSFGFANISKQQKNTSETKIRIGSINKHYTAVLIMQKVQSGELSLDDKLAKFSLGFADDMAKKISIRHLLQHKAGFADIFNDQYFRTYRSLTSIDDKLPLLIDKPLISEPGSQYNYSNYGYIVLGAILEKLEQKPFKTILDNNILKVIGAENTEYALTEQVLKKARSYHFNAIGEKIDRTERLENVTPDGGMYSTSADIALFFSKLFYSDILLTDKYKGIMGNGYSDTTRKWSEIVASEKALWRSYGGGPGVSAAAEIAIKKNLIVVVLANTDGLVAEHISQRIMASAKGKEYDKVILPLGVFANNMLEQQGDKYFREQGKQALHKAGYGDFGPRALNKLGFGLMKNNQLERAITVFITNTELFPSDANVFDSLGLAYEKRGAHTKALENYKIAVQLNPNFESSVEAVKRLSQASSKPNT